MAQLGVPDAQGEYFDFRVNRLNALPDLHFSGGYIQAGYMLTGEHRKYNPAKGVYGAISPKDPFNWAAWSWDAWEIGARYSQMTLNDLDIRGGELSKTTVDASWYVNSNIRFMPNWIHGRVAKTTAADIDVGARYDAFATRMQAAFQGTQARGRIGTKGSERTIPPIVLWARLPGLVPRIVADAIAVARIRRRYIACPAKIAAIGITRGRATRLPGPARRAQIG